MKIEIQGVDLWFGRVEQVPAHALSKEFLPALSPHERQRHDSFASDTDRHVYLLGHAMVRAALTLYLKKPAGEWRFAPEAGGKPRIVAPVAAPLEFSLSHTRGLAVCAFTRNVPVGVDVEPVARGDELQEIVERRFAESERRMIESLPPSFRGERSVWLWTAKEALLKAWGRGLGVPLETVPFSWGADGCVRLEADAASSEERWHFARFRIDGAFLGTIALRGKAEALTCFRVEGDALHPRQVEAGQNADGYLEIGN